MKFTIITVCLNSEKEIEETIKSVVEQDYKDYEYLIVDGKSSDKTLNIVDKYKDRISKVVSEKDQGIYDAMNKGVRMSSGDFIIFMNAGDTFVDTSVLQDVYSFISKISLAKQDSAGVVYGNALVDFQGEVVKNKYPRVSKKFFYDSMICHQAIFFSRESFFQDNLFDKKYKLCADYDWLLRSIYFKGINSKYFDRDICIFKHGGASSSENIFKERREIIKNYYSIFEILFYKTILFMKRFVANLTSRIKNNG